MAKYGGVSFLWFSTGLKPQPKPNPSFRFQFLSSLAPHYVFLLSPYKDLRPNWNLEPKVPSPYSFSFYFFKF